MTDAPRVVRGAGKDAQWLSDRATKRGLPVWIAGLDFQGDRTTFNFGAAGAKMMFTASRVLQKPNFAVLVRAVVASGPGLRLGARSWGDC